MKRCALLATFASLLLGGLLFVNYRRQQTPAYLLGQYPRSANFDAITRNHLGRVPGMIFYADWFDGDDTANSKGCRVDQSGSRTCEVYANNRSQAMSSSSIPPARLARFQKALRDLPPSETVAPPLSRVLILSYRDNDKWTTRLYDRSHLPRQIFRLNEFQFFATIPEGRGRRAPSPES